MFKRNTQNKPPAAVQAVERITSVLGAGVIWQGSITGSGGVRVEGTFEGQIALKGLLVVGETGKVTCENVRAVNVIVAGALKGNITAQKVEIRSTGRIWGDIVATAFATEEGAFLRGQIRMEDAIDLGFEAVAEPVADALPRDKAKKPVEESAGAQVEAPVEAPVEMPVEEPVQMPAGIKVEKTVKKSPGKTPENTVGKPAAPPTRKKKA